MLYFIRSGRFSAVKTERRSVHDTRASIIKIEASKYSNTVRKRLEFKLDWPSYNLGEAALIFKSPPARYFQTFYFCPVPLDNTFRNIPKTKGNKLCVFSSKKKSLTKRIVSRFFFVFCPVFIVLIIYFGRARATFSFPPWPQLVGFRFS